MLYNYSLEIGTVLFMTIILLHFLTSRQFPVIQTRLFFLFLIFSISECIIDVFSCIGIGYKDVVPLWLNEILVFVYFLVQGITYYLFYLYTVSVCSFSEKKGKVWSILGAIPVAGHLFLVISAPFNGFLYYFDENNLYHHGEGRLYLYLFALVIVFMGTLIAYKNKERLRIRYKAIILSYSLICCVTLFVQYHWPQVIITGFGRSCVVLLMYLSMQNMGEYTDNTLGIYNSSAFPVMFKEMQKNQKFAMITLELETYYKVAVQLGTRKATLLLRQVASKLYRIGKKYHVFRNGYATFVILTEANPERVEYIVDTIRSLLQMPWVVDGRSIYLNGNLIVQYYPEQFATIEEATSFSTYLLERAAIFGNNVNLYGNEELVSEFKRNAEVEQALDYALKQETLDVYYQPIYSVGEDKITSAEALVRLFDRKLGFVSPAEFIPIAEKNGRIIALGNLVMEKSCRFIKEKLLTNPNNLIEEIHINVSAIQCMQPDMSEQVLSIIDKYQVPPEMIYLEVTEQATMSATLLMREHMKKLGERGVHFALDDYGTGNSNCSYLIDFSFQKVKFDRFMMQAYFEKEDAKVILQNEIGTLKKLGISVVVEGIETREQVEEMENQKVDYIQGYYYAKPMPGTEFLEYLEKWYKEHGYGKRIPTEVLTLG